MYVCVVTLTLFFFKQKTAYEKRISDWSSDVCSSDLIQELIAEKDGWMVWPVMKLASPLSRKQTIDRKSVVSGKSVSVRVDLGGRRIIKKKTPQFYFREQNKPNSITIRTINNNRQTHTLINIESR